MDPRHKKKAVIGVVIWLSVLPVVLLANHLFYAHISTDINKLNDLDGILVLVALLGLYCSFFWGAGHLAKAKGYSGAMLMWGVFCLISQPILWAVLWFALPDRLPSRESSRRRKRQRDESPVARVIRCRRNALIFNVLGIAGILLAVLIACVPLGLFEQRDNAMVAGILIFIPAYGSTLYGCWFWTKAKNWPDAVLFIGLLPLVPMFIPFVRILYFHFLFQILPILMIFAPIIMISVIAVLPDKSGLPKRKRWDRDSWERGNDE
jgi:hypothetical protein